MSRNQELPHRELLYQLMLSEERYQNFMNAATDSIFISNLNGFYLDANKAACDVLGYTHKELTNMRVWDIEIGFSEESIKQIVASLADGPFNVEGRHKKKDGTTFPVDVRLSAFKSMGEPFILAIVRDISEQKHATSTIRRLTGALEQIPLLVIITDKTGTIEYVNTKVIEHTGYEYHEIVGQNSRMLQSDKTPAELYKSIWKFISSGQTWYGELLNINKKGEHYRVSATFSPLRDENNVETTHYLAVMNPVSMSSSL